MVFFASDPWNKSDRFFRRCLLKSDPAYTYDDPPEEIDSDGFAANEFYVILHKIFKYDSSEDLDSFVLNKVYLWEKARYTGLKEQCKLEVRHTLFSYLSSSSCIRYIQVYDNRMPVVKLCVSVCEDFSVEIMVHGNQVPSSLELWTKIPRKCYSINDIRLVLQIVSRYKVCSGNSDPGFQDVMRDLPVGSFADVPLESNYVGYKDVYGEPSVRSRQCDLLLYVLDVDGRCKSCSTYRRILLKALRRKAENGIETPTNWLESHGPNNELIDTQKLDKMKQLKRYASSLEAEVEILKKRLRHASKEDHTYVKDRIAFVMCDMGQEV